MLFSGYALMGAYRSVSDYRNSPEGSVPGSTLPPALKMQYLYATVIAAFEVVLIVYLLRRTSALPSSTERNIRFLLIILVPELYALFLFFGSPAPTVECPSAPEIAEETIKLEKTPSSYDAAAELLKQPKNSDK